MGIQLDDVFRVWNVAMKRILLSVVYCNASTLCIGTGLDILLACHVPRKQTSCSSGVAFSTEVHRRVSNGTRASKRRKLSPRGSFFVGAHDFRYTPGGRLCDGIFGLRMPFVGISFPSVCGHV